MTASGPFLCPKCRRGVAKPEHRTHTDPAGVPLAVITQYRCNRSRCGEVFFEERDLPALAAVVDALGLGVKQ